MKRLLLFIWLAILSPIAGATVYRWLVPYDFFNTTLGFALMLVAAATSIIISLILYSYQFPDFLYHLHSGKSKKRK